MENNPATIPLRGDHITLAQALKVAGLAESGGQAKHLIRAGEIHVNGTVELRPGRKLVAHDRLTAGERAWVIQP